MAEAQIVAHASPRAISGVPPENPVRRDAEHHTRDAYAPQTHSALPHLESLFRYLL
jgi:hypothetical protein